MIANDLSVLRQSRLLAKNVEVYLPSDAEEEAWFSVDQLPLAAEHIARWRRWFPWLTGSLVVTGLLILVGAPVILTLLFAAIGLGREVFLAVNVLEWMVPANWFALTRWEKLRLRVIWLTSALALEVIALGVIALAFYFFFVSNEPLSWRHFAFTAVYGSAALPSGIGCYRLLRKALRSVPPSEASAERPI